MEPNEGVPHYKIVLSDGSIYFLLFPVETPACGEMLNCFTTEEMLETEEGPVSHADCGFYHYPYNGNYGYNITIHNPDETEQRFFAIPTYVFDKFTEVNYIR